MKKLFNLFVFMAVCLTVSASLPASPGAVQKKIKSIRVFDLSDGSERLIELKELTYDDRGRLVLYDSKEYDQNAGDGSFDKTARYTFAYGAEGQCFAETCWSAAAGDEGCGDSGTMTLDDRGRVKACRYEMQVGRPLSMDFSYSYDTDNNLVRTVSDINDVSATYVAEWKNGNMVHAEYDCSGSEQPSRCTGMLDVVYGTEKNDACIDMAQLILFGTGEYCNVHNFRGPFEANFMEGFGNRIKNMPVMFKCHDGESAGTMSVNYTRDASDRITEINIEELYGSVYRDVYKYVIEYN